MFSGLPATMPCVCEIALSGGTSVTMMLYGEYTSRTHCTIAFHSASAAAPVWPCEFSNSSIVYVAPPVPLGHEQPPPPQFAPPWHGIDECIARASSPPPM